MIRYDGENPKLVRASRPYRSSEIPWTDQISIDIHAKCRKLHWSAADHLHEQTAIQVDTTPPEMLRQDQTSHMQDTNPETYPVEPTRKPLQQREGQTQSLGHHRRMPCRHGCSNWTR